MEKMHELHIWRQQTFEWAKCVVAHPTQILGGPWPTWPTLFRPYGCRIIYEPKYVDLIRAQINDVGEAVFTRPRLRQH